MSRPEIGGGLVPVADEDDDPPLAAGEVVGEYRIEQMIGSGGMGEVYLARHPVIDKRVAVKVMNRACSHNPIHVERFVQEAKSVNAIGHANIVDIFSFGRTADARCFFVMELLRGESLRTRMNRGIVSLDDTYRILDAVLRALEAAHALGIVHRDLKPDNIFLVAARDGEPERVKLLDFGIAKLSGGSLGPRGSKTQTGSVVGTPTYMSPEQAAGAAVEAPSDIYSLGVVAYELACGRVPFVGETAVEIMAGHVAEPAPLPSKFGPVSLRLESLLLGMLEKKPSTRPTPAEIRAELEALRAEKVPPGPRGTPDAPTLQGPALTPRPRSEVSLATRALGTPPVATPSIAPPSTATPAPIRISFEAPAHVITPTGVVLVPRRTGRGWIIAAVALLAATAIVVGMKLRAPGPDGPPPSPPAPVAPAPAPSAPPPAPVAPAVAAPIVVDAPPAPASPPLAPSPGKAKRSRAKPPETAPPPAPVSPPTPKPPGDPDAVRDPFATETP